MAWQANKQSSWSYWRGSYGASPGSRKQPPWKSEGHYNGPWKDSKGAGKGDNKGNHKQSFPKYDSQEPPQILPLTETTVVKEGSSGVVQQVQRMVTAARKAENRTRKAQQELVEKKRQWVGYQEQLKCAFQAEQKRHLSDVAKLEATIKEAQAEEIAAKQLLQPSSLSSFEDVVMDHSSGPSSADSDFASLISGAGMQHVGSLAPLSSEDGQDVATPQRSTRQLPSTPLGARPLAQMSVGESPALPFGSVRRAATPTAATSDPYQVPVPPAGPAIPLDPPLESKGGEKALTHTCTPAPVIGGAPEQKGDALIPPTAPPAPHHNVRSRSRENLGVRTSVKDGAKASAPHHSPGKTNQSLADKLEARRQTIAQDAVRKAQEVKTQGVWMGPPVPVAGNASGSVAGHVPPPGPVTVGPEISAPRTPVLILDDDFSESELDLFASQAEAVERSNLGEME